MNNELNNKVIHIGVEECASLETFLGKMVEMSIFTL